MDNNELLEKVLEVIKLEISKKAFNTWFKDTSLVLRDNETLVIYVANEFASDWVRKHYFNLLHATAKNILNKEVGLIISSKNTEEASSTIASLL